MNIAYVRKSIDEQNEKKQIEELQKYNIDKWYTEEKSAKDTNRTQLQAMLDFVNEGDTIYLYDLERLSRDHKDIFDIVEMLKSKKVNLVSRGEKIDVNTFAEQYKLLDFLKIPEPIVDDMEEEDDEYPV